jgi:hypothetical protein
MKLGTFCVLLLAFLSTSRQVNANVGVLLEEPYSYDGALAGTGHAAIYLTRVCAASPTCLRRCNEGEDGVVISRYNRIGRYDWIAIPLIAYLYAVTKPEDIPVYADSEIASFLRDQYRRENLENLAPDDSSGQAPGGNWVQLIGSAYDRTSFVYEIETTPQQDDDLIQRLNSSPNRASYRGLSRNCADFVRDIVNFYYPKAVSRGVVADFGITTPKRTARSLVRYSQRHPDLEFASLVIPQVPGTIRRSRPVRGIVESVFKAKKYLIPLAFFHPYVAGGVALAYLAEGRFRPEKKAMIFNLRGGAAESPLTENERDAYRRDLEKLPEAFPADRSRRPGDFWQEFRAKSQLSADETGHLSFQGPFRNRLVRIGISQENFLNGDAPRELQRELLMTRFQLLLKGGAVPKTSGADLRAEWKLLQMVISMQEEQQEPPRQAGVGIDHAGKTPTEQGALSFTSYPRSASSFSRGP